MSKNDKAVFPQLDGPCQVGLPAYEGGITLREYAAILRAAAMDSNPEHVAQYTAEEINEQAVHRTDALLAELAKGGGE